MSVESLLREERKLLSNADREDGGGTPTGESMRLRSEAARVRALLDLVESERRIWR